MTDIFENEFNPDFFTEYARNNGLKLSNNQLITPLIRDEFRFNYTLIEYRPLLDSSNMGPDEWIKIAKDILVSNLKICNSFFLLTNNNLTFHQDNYFKFDGFVVLHGTDTMCNTASALSFILENLGKSVIVTGSQISIFEPMNDGVNNFLASLIFAGSRKVNEVAICFDNKLFRGNRTRKISPESYRGFESPNISPLAEIGTIIQFTDQ